MIVKRNRDKKLPRMIVRRSQPTVGEKPRAIVPRHAGVVGTRGRSEGRERAAPAAPRISLKPRLRYVWAASAVLWAAILGYGGWWLYESPAFRVNHVKVTGNERTSTDEIVRLTGLFGDSMFTANLADTQEVLFSFPLISSVDVKRDWPNSVQIVIEERQAWGTWEQGGVRYTIDRDGVVLGTEGPPAGSPQIKTSEATTLRVGDRVSYQAVDAAAEIYEKLPRQLGTTVTEIAYVTGTGVQVTTASGQNALLGDSSSIAYKLSVWAALSTEARNRGITYTTIDLRYGNRPVLY
ncbi:MAG: FtsQ-type POTRA domain-containing protein [Dehalococcoidia bacterium]